MPECELRVYRERSGRVPLLEFMDGLAPRAQAKIIAAIERLRALGQSLRPPHTEHLGGQIYYLRIRIEGGTCRVFYWPHGREVLILGHGFSKKTAKCPPSELSRAKAMRAAFEANPEQHTAPEDF